MTDTTKKPQLSLNKENLGHLKVRTDLKGGAKMLTAVSCCTSTHHCASAFSFNQVINPISTTFTR